MAEKRQRDLREMWSLTVTNKKKKKDAAGNNVMFSRRLPKQMPVRKRKVLTCRYYHISLQLNDEVGLNGVCDR